MTNYGCPRCGYSTINKTHMNSHLDRKNMCKSLLKDIIPKNYVDEIFKVENNLICEKCNKEFSRPDSTRRHEKICKIEDDDSSKDKNEIKILKFEKLLKQKEEHIKLQEKHIKNLIKKLENNRLLCNTTKDRIRQNSRSIYKKSGLSMSCLNCNYDKHVHICHIKEISDFKTSDKVTDINDLSNLVALCSNCHHELDKLKNPNVIRKVHIHSILITTNPRKRICKNER
jgi:hypothetical protein